MRNVVLFMAAAAIMVLAACNTMSGAGKDVSAAGHTVTNTAEEAKH